MKRNSARRGQALILEVGLSTGVLLLVFVPAETPAEIGKVVRVVDSDAIRVKITGQEHIIRLIGVDTPETKHPTKAVENFGQEANDFTKAKLQGKTVRLQKDPTGDTRDQGKAYGAARSGLICGKSPTGVHRNASSLSGPTQRRF